jgi:hypothetical protein
VKARIARDYLEHRSAGTLPVWRTQPARGRGPLALPTVEADLDAGVGLDDDEGGGGDGVGFTMVSSGHAMPRLSAWHGPALADAPRWDLELIVEDLCPAIARALQRLGLGQGLGERGAKNADAARAVLTPLRTVIVHHLIVEDDPRDGRCADGRAKPVLAGCDAGAELAAARAAARSLLGDRHHVVLAEILAAVDAVERQLARGLRWAPPMDGYMVPDEELGDERGLTGAA